MPAARAYRTDGSRRGSPPLGSAGAAAGGAGALGQGEEDGSLALESVDAAEEGAGALGQGEENGSLALESVDAAEEGVDELGPGGVDGDAGTGVEAVGSARGPGAVLGGVGGGGTATVGGAMISAEVDAGTLLTGCGCWTSGGADTDATGSVNPSAMTTKSDMHHVSRGNRRLDCSCSRQKLDHGFRAERGRRTRIHPDDEQTPSGPARARLPSSCDVPSPWPVLDRPVGRRRGG